MKRKQTKNVSKSELDTNEVVLQTERDFKTALLVVSLTSNLFIVSMWVALQVTSRYDTALAGFFLDR